MITILNALAWHTVRLMTLRHDGAGLPRPFSLMACILALCAGVVAAVRWLPLYPPYSVALALALCMVILAFIALFVLPSIRSVFQGVFSVVHGYLLISIAADVTAIAAYYGSDGLIRIDWGGYDLWQIAAVIALIARCRTRMLDEYILGGDH